jgi:hypothetical protein
MNAVISIVIFLGIFIFVAVKVDENKARKPWWSGTSSQEVCVKYNPNNSNCYNLPVTAEGSNVLQISFPNGGYSIIEKTDCDKAITFKGVYCVVSDSEGNTWQINKRD